MVEWLACPEQEWLQALLSEELDAAMESFVSADGRDPAQIGRLQATVKLLRWFVSGDYKDSLLEDVREWQNKRQ